MGARLDDRRQALVLEHMDACSQAVSRWLGKSSAAREDFDGKAVELLVEGAAEFDPLADGGWDAFGPWIREYLRRRLNTFRGEFYRKVRRVGGLGDRSLDAAIMDGDATLASTIEDGRQAANLGGRPRRVSRRASWPSVDETLLPTLPQSWRDAWRLRQEGVGYADIASRLGMASGKAVSGVLERAKAKLVRKAALAANGTRRSGERSRRMADDAWEEVLGDGEALDVGPLTCWVQRMDADLPLRYYAQVDPPEGDEWLFRMEGLPTKAKARIAAECFALGWLRATEAAAKGPVERSGGEG